MQFPRWMPIMMISAFLMLAAGAALASGGDHGDDASSRREAHQARVAELREARNASLESFHENRTAAIAEYRAAHNATKASFLENKTRVIDECNAARNATEDDNNSAYAKCVSDGLRPLIEQARAEHAEQREAFRARMTEARQTAIAAFLEARAEINQRRAAA